MGVQWIIVQFMVMVCCSVMFLDGVSAYNSKRDYSDEELCLHSACNCTNTANWKTINCTLQNTENLQIRHGSIPATTIELSISGGNKIVISEQSFHMHRGFNLLRVEGAKSFVISKHGFNNLNSTAMDLQVHGCERFLLEKNAFKNMETPIRVSISNTAFVSIENSAFGRLQDARFQGIKKLVFAEGAFTFENQGDNGRHGPVTNLSFNNVKIPEIPRATFVSALALVSIQDSEIQNINMEAFKATQINEIYINHTTIHKLRSGALSEGTLIVNFILSKCSINVIEEYAILAAITNLTIQFSSITEIHTGAINSTMNVNIMISDNQINSLAKSSLVFNSCNRFAMENNIIKILKENFLEVPYKEDVIEFVFAGNEIHDAERGAFVALPLLQKHLVHFKFNSNSFKKTCYCNISEWLSELLLNPNSYYVYDTSFCTVDNLLARCFVLNEGLINMKNFTALTCGSGSDIHCEPYRGETKKLNTTKPFLVGEEGDKNIHHYVTALSILLLLIVVIIIYIYVIRPRCQRRSSLEYEEQEVVPQDGDLDLEHVDYTDIPPLTEELLVRLRKELNDPDTAENAATMIQKLYEEVVKTDRVINNNRQDDEAHLYEELGNMHSGHHSTQMNRPSVNDYSEPKDAAHHVYTELRTRGEDKRASLTSTGSKMATRPLPEQPKDENEEAGPSSSAR
ncbi:PREDICTED: uncharacterized protein LOC108569692 [Nicrophorus vespilloides]|uniref:Uncharacterized protein LOC108569692 n=1 Tax=Nicrophorus vespilloides TaxID=110193 RepID=A0ABM1NJ28_NICVS|nr:PREDICTED: uncharacterized protein LOC108569692 [Nicrophorus vespilloides]